METIKSFCRDFTHGYFKENKPKHNGANRIHSIKKMQSDIRYTYFENWLQEIYIEKGMGIKRIIKDFQLEISYSQFRSILLLMKIPFHSNRIANGWLKHTRREKVKKEHSAQTGWFSKTVIREHTHRGIQGKFFNETRQKFVHLRSSYEYIFARWLNEKGIEWDVEVRQYKLKSGSHYKPDFFIFEGGILKKIVEIKGWKDSRFFKAQELKEDLKPSGIEVITILGEEISYYTDDIASSVNQWKKLNSII